MPTRRVSREIALQALFSVEVGHRDPSEVLDEYLLSSADSAHRFFVQDLVLGTLSHAQESDRVIAPLLTDWTIERLPTIDRLLLRMAAFELKHRPDTPRPVVINETIELAKRFSTEDSGRFINGVLSSMIEGTSEEAGVPSATSSFAADRGARRKNSRSAM